jgi:hypothetical protein
MVTVKHQDDYDDVKPKEKVHVVKRPTKKVRDRSRGASSRLNNFRVQRLPIGWNFSSTIMTIC